MVVTASTTNEAAVRAIADKQGLVIKIITGKDHDDAFGLLVADKADAFAIDDILLYGLVAPRKAGDHYHIVGDLFVRRSPRPDGP